MNNKESDPLILIISTVGAVGFVTKASRLFRKPAGFWAATYSVKRSQKANKQHKLDQIAANCC